MKEINAQQTIQQQLNDNPIVLYMKGSPDFPQCGFSARVVQILEEYDIPYYAVNVLEDEAIRQGIKAYGNWPTIPQLYVKGKLIGGCDIVSELHEQGKLEKEITL